MTQTPTAPERVRTLAFWIIAATGVAGFLVAGLARIWWPDAYAPIEETAALVEAALTLLGGILGLAAIPGLTRSR